MHASRKIHAGKNVPVPKTELTEKPELAIAEQNIGVVRIEDVGASHHEFPKEKRVEKDRCETGEKER